MKILVLGASGMIGHTMFRVLATAYRRVWGTIRNPADRTYFSDSFSEQLLLVDDLARPDVLTQLFEQIKPEVVINCVGLTKHRRESNNSQLSIAINSLLPHRLSDCCAAADARLIHVSTDCVFSGLKGNYSERDVPDALDIYGKSKYLGEVSYPHTVTLRTSTIGHELHSTHGLLEWFLCQHGHCKGFSRAIFSGLPTIVFSQVVRDFVLSRRELTGLYHVSATPINKLELLRLIAKLYGKKIDLIPDDSFVIDRSLNGSRFSYETGYVAPDWEEMISLMHAGKV